MTYVRAALLRHLDTFWPRRQKDPFVWTIGPIRASLPDLEVVRVYLAAQGEPWIYVTVGAWAGRRAGTHGLEFMLISPEDDPIHVETLSMVANFHADPTYGLALGHVVDIGRPWMDGSKCDHLLVSVPYPLGPGFEHCVIGAYHIRFLWLMPITAAEAAYEREHGQEALERKLEEARVNPTDKRRASVV